MRLTSMCAAVSLLAATGCFFDGDLKHDGPTTPEPLGDGWEIATPEDVGLSRAALDGIHRELLREDRYIATLGFLVIKDGKLVYETYLRSIADRDHYHHVQSATKSVTSIAFGLAKDRGAFDSLSATVEQLFPDKVAGLDARKRAITLENLFAMRSGMNFDNSDFSVEMWVDKPSDPIRYILDKPLYANPGERYYYRDCDPQMVGYAIQRAMGMTEEALVREHVFAPLGITDYYWDKGAQGETMGAHGLHLRPRDLAKIGWFALQQGSWNGTPIVSQEWMAEATRPQTQTTVPDLNGVPYDYGHYWWIVRDEGPACGAAASTPCFSAWGHGGQYALVVPEKRMVLVQIAFPDSALHGDNLNDFVQLVRPLLQAP